MDETGSDRPRLIGNGIPAGDLELVEQSTDTAEDQHHAPEQLIGWLGERSIGAHLSGLVNTSQKHAIEIMNRVRSLPVGMRASAVVLQNYGQLAVDSAARTFEKVRALTREAPEATTDYAAIFGMFLLALAGGTDWDTRRDRLDCYTLLPGQQPHYWGNPHAIIQTPRSSSTHPSRLARLLPSPKVTIPHAELLLLQQPLPHHQLTPASSVKVTQQRADLTTQHLVSLMGGAHTQYPNRASASSFAAIAHRTSNSAARYRRVRVRSGSLTIAVSGPTDGVYGRINAYQAKYPDAVVITDEPMFT